MKITKREYTSFGVGILTTLLFGIGIFYNEIADIFMASEDPQRLFKSGRIDSTEFGKLRRAYNKDNQAHKVKINGQFKPVEAFMFDREQIDSIIHFNHSLDTANHEKPDSIAVYLGTTGRNSNKLIFKLIILGTKTKTDTTGKEYSELLIKNRKDSQLIRTPGSISVYDKASSVPPSRVE